LDREAVLSGFLRMGSPYCGLPIVVREVCLIDFVAQVGLIDQVWSDPLGWRPNVF
jgi:hypothetical protein